MALIKENTSLKASANCRWVPRGRNWHCRGDRRVKVLPPEVPSRPVAPRSLGLWCHGAALGSLSHGESARQNPRDLDPHHSEMDSSRKSNHQWRLGGFRTHRPDPARRVWAWRCGTSAQLRGPQRPGRTRKTSKTRGCGPRRSCGGSTARVPSSSHPTWRNSLGATACRTKTTWEVSWKPSSRFTPCNDCQIMTLLETGWTLNQLTTKFVLHVISNVTLYYMYF